MDMALDDLIKSNKQSAPRGRGRAPGPGPARRAPNRTRSGPYSAPKAPDTNWGHDMYSGGAGGGGGSSSIVGGGRPSSLETGTKLYISNLDYGVSTEDIKELFAEVGDLKRCIIHYDRSGRSKGNAEVVFSRRQDALDAIQKYNNVQLDGKPMKIELVRTNINTPAAGVHLAAPFGDVNHVARSSNGQSRGGFGRSRGGGGGRGRGSGRGGRGQGRGPRNEKVSAEDLDADLEKYHSEAMQTNE